MDPPLCGWSRMIRRTDHDAQRSVDRRTKRERRYAQECVAWERETTGGGPGLWVRRAAAYCGDLFGRPKRGPPHLCPSARRHRRLDAGSAALIGGAAVGAVSISTGGKARGCLRIEQP